VVTGKPVAIGGSAGRREATGRGVVACLVEVARHLDMALDGASVAIQGYGQVGSAAARAARSLGAKIVAVSDVEGGIHDPRGLDLDSLDRLLAERGSLKDFPAAERVTNAELLELPCDVLIPAAIQNQVTEHNASRLRCRVMVEGANGPTTLGADRILAERGISVVPDVLANAGGVTVSYFEWVQDSQHLFWTEDEVNTRLTSIMQRAFREVLGTAQKQHVDLRTAALMTGIGRVAEAKRRRGVYP
jgi:glutamate dehydrogenase (NAD(P)+)